MRPGNVERWLLELEQLQWESVRKQVELSLNEYPKLERAKWTLNWPAQAVLATSQMFWTRDVEATINEGGSAGLNKFVLTLNNQLTQIVMLVRGKLTKLQRKTLSALVVMDVHARDTVVTMAKAQVEKITDFNWVSQLRYYWEPSWKDGQAVKKGDKTVIAHIVNARCESSNTLNSHDHVSSLAPLPQVSTATSTLETRCALSLRRLQIGASFYPCQWSIPGAAAIAL